MICFEENKTKVMDWIDNFPFSGIPHFSIFYQWNICNIVGCGVI